MKLQYNRQNRGHYTMSQYAPWWSVRSAKSPQSSLSRPQNSSNQILLYQVMSTRSGSTLVVRVPINFYKYFFKSHILVSYI
jgi:hypothetical protein